MSVVKNKVRELVAKEIKYISNLFPYNIKKFFNPNLIYSQNVLTFLNNDYPAASIFSPDFLYKLANLLAGIELTAIGVNLHSFNAKDFMLLAGNKKFRQKNEKSYTLDLLFGDIFYSRAVVYFMEYGDFLVFNGSDVPEGYLYLFVRLWNLSLYFHANILHRLQKVWNRLKINLALRSEIFLKFI